MSSSAKHTAAAAERNRRPILNVLRRILPDTGRILEIASGTGQHVVTFAEACPELNWFPSDPDAGARASIAAWVVEAGTGNVAAAMNIDVTAPGWFSELDHRFDGIVSINLSHVSPWAACEGLMAGAAGLLEPRGFLYLYGPFMRHGTHTSEGNKAFDEGLRRQNPAWGLRDVDDVTACARQNGLRLDEIVEMPANNLSLIFR
jgi:cyclopropane fatty-acyl-phospholipid synthase-like methyltransferase